MGAFGDASSETGRLPLDATSLRASAYAIAATTCGMLGSFVTSALAPLLRQDGVITPAQLGIAIAVYFAASATVAPLGGRLADRIGSIQVMRMALVVAAAALTAVAALVHGWVTLTVALGCAGSTNGAIQPSANRYLSRLIPAERQGLAFGIKQAAVPTAILLGGLAVPAATYLSGWREIYYAGAALAVLCAVATRKPSSMASGARPATRNASAPAARDSGRSVPDPLPRRALLLLASGWGLASAGVNALGAYFVLSATDAGFSTVTAGLLAVLGSLASIVTRVGVGFAADGWTGKGFGVVAGMCAVGAAGVAPLATGQAWTYILAALIGYGIGWGWAGVFSYAVVRTAPGKPGRTTGVTQAGAGAGACVGPLAFGAILTDAGYPAAWIAAGATLLVASGIVVAGRALLPAGGHPGEARSA